MDFKQSTSSLETLKLFCAHDKKRKRKRRERDRTSKSKKTKSLPKKICENQISQEIHVEKQDFKCIINLKTTLCNLTHNMEDKVDNITKTNSFPDIDSSIREKIITKCFRKSCKGTRTLNSKKQRTKSVPKMHHHHESKFMNRGISHSHRNSVDRHTKSRNKVDSTKQLLSPVLITSSPLNAESGNLTYEEISTDSLDTDYEYKPTHKKKRSKHRKHCRHCRHCSHRKKVESKLDTLIKRTKEREREMVAKSLAFHPPCCGTPLHKRIQYFTSNDIPWKPSQNEDYYLKSNENTHDSNIQKDVDEYTMYSSDMDISFVSRSTLVLDKLIPYSPSDIPEDNHSYYTSLNSLNNDYLDIKSEPTMDIEAYSPIQSPDNFVQNTPCVKKEVVKTDPVSSINNNNIGEGIFKGFQNNTKPNIKTECG